MNNFLGQMSHMLPLLGVGLVIYFMILRPQQQKMRKHGDALKALKRGDRVVLSGGILGQVRIAPAQQEEIQVEIAENVIVRVLRSMIVEIKP